MAPHIAELGLRSEGNVSPCEEGSVFILIGRSCLIELESRCSHLQAVIGTLWLIMSSLVTRLWMKELKSNFFYHLLHLTYGLIDDDKFTAERESYTYNYRLKTQIMRRPCNPLGFPIWRKQLLTFLRLNLTFQQIRHIPSIIPGEMLSWGEVRLRKRGQLALLRIWHSCQPGWFLIYGALAWRQRHGVWPPMTTATVHTAGHQQSHRVRRCL